MDWILLLDQSSPDKPAVKSTALCEAQTPTCQGALMLGRAQRARYLTTTRARVQGVQFVQMRHYAVHVPQFHPGSGRIPGLGTPAPEGG